MDYTSLVMSGLKPEEINEIGDVYLEITESLKTNIVGLEDIIEQVLIAIFSGNHCLLVGVPGLAKTLLVRSIGDLLALKFSRIQFTPDLMPSDVTGTEILTQDPEDLTKKFSFLKGPIFANLILADEINRTPPKTQAALLEAMEENTVTSVGNTFELESPFFVLATQNPIEQEGTYPLPAAQLDRFMFNILLDYPEEKEEHKIIRRTVSSKLEALSAIISQDKIKDILKKIRKVHISEEIMQYALRLCRYSRPHHKNTPPFVKENLAWGASPRAAQFLIIGGKTRAILQKRHFVTPQDIRAIMHPVFRHRIILNYKAEVDGYTPDEIVDRLIEITPAPDNFKLKARRTYSQKLYLSQTNR